MLSKEESEQKEKEWKQHLKAMGKDYAEKFEKNVRKKVQNVGEDVIVTAGNTSESVVQSGRATREDYKYNIFVRNPASFAIDSVTFEATILTGRSS
jgi:hypothetical protein